MEERKDRKRAQNRLNQRAHRQRIKDKRTRKNNKSTFTIHRWRLDDDEVLRSASTSARYDRHVHLQGASHLQVSRLAASTETAIETDDTCVAIAYQHLQLAMSLYADHLLHLVHFNALRGLVRNKSVIAKRAAYFASTDEPGSPLIPYVEECYPGSAVLVPTSGDATTVTSTALDPTQLQASISHAVWINLLPFPTWRNNLISWESYFNHAELVGDIIGNLIDLTHFFKPRDGNNTPPMGCGMSLSPTNIDEYSNNRTGLILWGEPHIAESWEFTAGFLRKWGWTLKGCEYIVESTNRWRLKRGEEPMRVTPC